MSQEAAKLSVPIEVKLIDRFGGGRGDVAPEVIQIGHFEHNVTRKLVLNADVRHLNLRRPRAVCSDKRGSAAV